MQSGVLFFNLIVYVNIFFSSYFAISYLRLHLCSPRIYFAFSYPLFCICVSVTKSMFASFLTQIFLCYQLATAIPASFGNFLSSIL